MTVLVLDKRHSVEEMRSWLRDVPGEIVVACGPRVHVDEHATTGHPLRFEPRPDYADSNWLTERCRELNITRIVALAESDIIRAACVRELLGLPGQPLASAIAYRDKYVMKSIASAAGVSVAPMTLVQNADDIHEFGRQHGYPLVVKPRDSGGSVGVFTVHNPHDDIPLDNQYTYLAETWIPHPHYHVDGLMQAGNVVHGGVFRNVRPRLESRQRALPCASVLLDQRKHAVAARLYDCAAATIRALPHTPDVTAFHAEFFCPPDGAPLLCEIACRPSSLLTTDVFRRAFGYDIFAKTLHGLATGDDTKPLPDTPAGIYAYAYFPTRDGVLVSYPSWDELPNVLRYDTPGKIGTRYVNPRSVIEHVASAVFTADPDHPEQTLHEIEQWWQNGVTWA